MIDELSENAENVNVSVAVLGHELLSNLNDVGAATEVAERFVENLADYAVCVFSIGVVVARKVTDAF